MVTGAPIAIGPDAVDDAKTYLRLEGAEEDGLIAALMASAAALCEQFTGQVLAARSFSEDIAASAAWTRLGRSPVRAITAVEAVDAAGVTAPLAAADYAIDIDASGDGWVRVLRPSGGRVRVSYEAGLAAAWEGAPEALRQGIVRLAAHLHAYRDSANDRGPPAAVTALWRPWRRMRVG